MVSFEAILYYLFLIDSLFANIFSWFYSDVGKKNKQLKKFYRYFPLTKGWSGLYLLIMLWVGFSLYRLGIL
tara:strand:- start:163 stop:375 length:213 start_codon:yes stop_codon:yes gene_type:complete